MPNTKLHRQYAAMLEVKCKCGEWFGAGGWKFFYAAAHMYRDGHELDDHRHI